MAARASGSVHSPGGSGGGGGGGIGGDGSVLLQFSSPFAAITALAVAACLLIMLVFVTIFAVLQVISYTYECRTEIRSPHRFASSSSFVVLAHGRRRRSVLVEHDL